MLTEDYCSQKVTKLLKEKGFKIPQYYNSLINMWKDTKVTHQMAMKWLREEHKLSIEISSTESDRWMACVYELGLTRYFVEAYISTYDTYKVAVEAALKYCLTELI